MKTSDIIFSYFLAFWALLGYWFAEIISLTGENAWVFQQSPLIIIPILTAFYGTWFLFAFYMRGVIFK